MKLFSELKLLIAEDEEKLANLLKYAIEDEFKEVVITKNGMEALAVFKTFKPDIIVTDITMPLMSGLELSRAIKKLKPDMPIVMISAYSEKEKFIEAIDVGVGKYLLKPFGPDELLNQIASLLKRPTADAIELNDDFIFYTARNALYKSSRFVSLSKNELKLISFLVQNRGRAVDASELKGHIWGESSDEQLRTLIKRLREKTTKNIIKNEKGIGYRV